MQPDAQYRPADGANVLFEPEMDNRMEENAKFDEEMEASSSKTNPGATGVKVGGGVAVTEKALLFAQ